MHTVTCRKLLPFIDPLCSKAGRNVRLRHGVDAPDLGGLPVTRRRLVKRKFGGGEQQQRQQQLPQHRERQQQLPRQRERQQAISPLPYWCEAVTVVGLPKDEIVFCFHTFTEAAATARRELRPEGWYGATAVKLAGMPSSKVSDILDRWQYACARQELAELDCRPMLWWRYHAAVRGLAKNAAARGAASNGSARLNRRQRRLAAQMAEEAQALVQVEAPVHHTAAGSSSSSASRSSDASAGSPNGCTNGGISVDKGWLDAAEQVQQHDGQQQDEFEQAGMPPKVHPKPQGKEQEPRAGQQAEIKENQQQKELQQATDQPHAAEQQQDERNLEQQERQEEQRQASAKLQPVLGSALAETSISGSCGMAATTKLLAALAGIAAAAAHVGAVLLRLPWTVWSAAVSACLGLYRRLLPVWFRRLFWQSWPPRVVEAHVSPSLAAFLADPACSEARLRAGFNAAGARKQPTYYCACQQHHCRAYRPGLMQSASPGLVPAESCAPFRLLCRPVQFAPGRPATMAHRGIDVVWGAGHGSVPHSSHPQDGTAADAAFGEGKQAPTELQTLSRHKSRAGSGMCMCPSLLIAREVDSHLPGPPAALLEEL